MLRELKILGALIFSFGLSACAEDSEADDRDALLVGDGAVDASLQDSRLADALADARPTDAQLPDARPPPDGAPSDGPLGVPPDADGGGDDPCQDDGTEPNDVVADAVDLGDPRFGVADDDGEVPQGVVHRVGLDLEICARDEDVFCFPVEDGDTVEAWTVGDGVAGDFNVQLIDGAGAFVGLRGNHNRQGNANRARWIGADGGLACVRVDGVGAAEGPYLLFIRRDDPDQLCAQDVDEFMRPRNDLSAGATEMTEIVPTLRFEHVTGAVCDVDGADEDWYVVPIQPETSMCVMLTGFQDRVADLDLALYASDPDGLMCADDAGCMGAGARCVAGRCAPVAHASNGRYDFEVVRVGRPAFGPDIAEGFLRVHRGAVGGETGYALTVTTVGDHDPADCPPDFHERPGANGAPAGVEVLGSGSVGFCDAWICEHREGQIGHGDRYQITVPANQDRTVLIEYAGPPVDARLSLDAIDLDWVAHPNDPFGGMRRSNTVVENVQCINVRGGDRDREVQLNVQLDGGAQDDRDGRVDYSMYVVPTDLDARPAGDCQRLGARNLDACMPNGDPLPGADCWPTLRAQ